MKSLKRNHFSAWQILSAAFPFLAMDWIVRLSSKPIIIEVGNSSSVFSPVYSPTPNLFTLLWIAFFLGITFSAKGNGRRILYGLFFGLSYIAFAANLIYYRLTGFYFSFSLLKMADEGSSYVMDVITGTPIYLYAIMAAVLIWGIAVVVFMKTGALSLPMLRSRCFLSSIFLSRGKWILSSFFLFLLLHTLIPFSLGKASDGLEWKSFKNGRNVYNSFNDVNKSMMVSGLYEFEIRNFYITFLKPSEKMSEQEASFLEEAYADRTPADSNSYTGLFQGKNVIFLQMEGIDTWMLNETDTPNLWSLKEHSIDFTDHYSIYTGGGSTFNSEFAVNTGFTTPITYEQNVYMLNNNRFPHSLPRKFKEQGYAVNAFHMNSGEFYNRGINYRNWGYDNYFSLMDSGDYSDSSYDLDRELILNPTFYQEMFCRKEPFVHYLITYTPHTPFTTDKGVGKMLAEEKYGPDSIPDLSEEEVARMEAGETDYMVGLLIQALKDNNLYDNTVIIAFTDHYLYTLNDKTVLDRYKNTDDNRINQTPFFIWSSDLTPEKITSTTMQMNILPTVLNLFGISYTPSDYLMTDALAPDYAGLAFFADFSWYDGTNYVENDMPETIQNLIQKNDLTLKYNYFANH
ncbi:MAG: LTA synthase family protein [Lachnospiraceae bacterium]|nr:LTA synthase family protein [Lachnospiraceae bacterium]